MVGFKGFKGFKGFEGFEGCKGCKGFNGFKGFKGFNGFQGPVPTMFCPLPVDPPYFTYLCILFNVQIPKNVMSIAC